MHHVLRTHAVILAIVICVALSGCQHAPSSLSTSEKSLYDRLGGQAAVSAVVSDFVDRAAADPKVNFTRQGHPNHWDATSENVAKLKEHLTQFVAQATGGPKEYHGKDMPAVHKDMQITNEEFDAIAADLKASLDKFNVPAKEQGELMAIVGSTREQIVGK